MHLLEFFWLCFYNRQPQRFCVVKFSTFFGVFDMMLWCFCFDSGGTILGGLALVIALLNIPSSGINAAVWEPPNVINGLAGSGLHISKIKSCTAWMAALVEDIFGMV